jgi:hypothetical protein
MPTSSARRRAEEGVEMGAGAEKCATCAAVAVLSSGRRPSSTSERLMAPVSVRRQSRFVSRRACEVREAVKVHRCIRAELAGRVGIDDSFGSWLTLVVSSCGSAVAIGHEPGRETKFPMGLQSGSCVGVRARRRG